MIYLKALLLIVTLNSNAVGNESGEPVDSVVNDESLEPPQELCRQNIHSDESSGNQIVLATSLLNL